MREEKFHIYLNDDEYSRLIQSLIRLKNSLTAQGRCTDAVDDILYKVLSAKRRKFKIKYIRRRIFLLRQSEILRPRTAKNSAVELLREIMTQ